MGETEKQREGERKGRWGAAGWAPCNAEGQWNAHPCWHPLHCNLPLQGGPGYCAAIYNVASGCVLGKCAS